MKSINILAQFRMMNDAELAMSELKNLGIEEVRVDRIHMYGNRTYHDMVNPLTSNFDSLSYLTLGSINYDKSVDIFQGSNVYASGMADGDPNTIGNDVLLTAIVNEEKKEEVREIIEKYGGRW